MICVSIGRTRHKMVVLEQRALAEAGAELVELRLDWLQHPPDLGRLLLDRPTPVVVTARSPRDKGRWRYSEEQRLTVLRAAIAEGAEYVDLEDRIADRIPRYGQTKRIVSHHNFDETPPDIEEIHAQACRLDPDIVKIVTMANSPSDSVRMLRLVEKATVPTIGFCMGELGLVSRILCGKYGSPFTYASFSSERELAPGQPSFETMRDIYRFDAINRDTLIFGVLGDPIAQSLSPLVHNAAFEHEGINAVYLPLRVPHDILATTLDYFEWLGIRGYSVTIPHKEEALTRAAGADDLTHDIGAANTLFHNHRGEWQAANTDCDAALTSLRLGMSASPATTDGLLGKRAIVLGAGGAARAIGFGLVRAGTQVTIVSRTHKRAIALAEQLGCQQATWANRGAIPADILINCTPVGMHPDVNETPYEAHWLRDGMVVFDTVYNPENTLLIKEARQRECPVVSGIEMFVRQAARQFEYFTGRSAPIDHIRDTLRWSISAVR